MRQVAVTGYVAGYSIQEGSSDQYGLINLLQFGSRNQPTELIPLHVYDPEIRDWLKKIYQYGKINPASFKVSIVTFPKTKETLWIVERVIEYSREDVLNGNVGTGSSTEHTGQTQDNNRKPEFNASEETGDNNES